ncbi:MAG: hypothetical protein U5L04_03205 [Trueperaceae bacterium]|nr:hypothetical protein [Trueperaceae bacterium]
MKIRCDCGHSIVDQTDALPYKAHLIPDQHWFTLLDAIDDAIETTTLHPQQQEREMMRLRTLVGRLSRAVWQCSACGTLLVDVDRADPKRFRPVDSSLQSSVLSTRDKK